MLKGVVLHVYEDKYPPCFLGKIGGWKEYKAEGFKLNRKREVCQDHTKDHNKGRNNHFDPEWEHLTYADLPFDNPHACLRGLRHGDYIFFNCNLRKCKDSQEFNKCRTHGDVSGPECGQGGKKWWYIIGYFKLAEDPKTTDYLVRNKMISRAPYKYNAHVYEGSYKEDIKKNVIFIGSRRESKLLKSPYPLHWKNASRYGIIVKHKPKKTELEKLKDTFRCKLLNENGLKCLLRDIDQHQKTASKRHVSI